MDGGRLPSLLTFPLTVKSRYSKLSQTVAKGTNEASLSEGSLRDLGRRSVQANKDFAARSPGETEGGSRCIPFYGARIFSKSDRRRVVEALARRSLDQFALF